MKDKHVMRLCHLMYFFLFCERGFILVSLLFCISYNKPKHLSNLTTTVPLGKEITVCCKGLSVMGR